MSMYHSPVRSCILLLCSLKSRFSETYFIHFTYGPMVIFDHLKQDFWSSLVLSLKQKKLQQICCHTPDRNCSETTRAGSIWLKNMQAANFIGNRTRNKNSKFWVLAPLYLGNGKSHTKYVSMLKKRYFYKEHEERVVEK